MLTVLLIVHGAARPDRRLRWLEQHPGEVETRDVGLALLRHGLAAADVALVLDRASALGIRPFTMWMGIQAYGAHGLAVAVAGDLPHERLLEHLGDGSVPAFRELEVLAALNGLAAATGGDGGGRRHGPASSSGDLAA